MKTIAKSKVIYIADDEQNIRDLVKSYLLKEGYEVYTYASGDAVLEAFIHKPSDMLIIDIMMPGLDGYSLCREIRKTSEVPIIMISAKDEEIDRILGLELGSDDYISKPFSPRELVARVKTIFRRIRDDQDMPSAQTEEKRNEIGCRDILIFPDERRVCKGDLDIGLTSKEFDFLVYLVKNRNRVYTREQLITGIWGYDFIGDTRAVDDLVKRVRKKLLEAGSELEIVTVWGYGYKVIDV